MFAAILLELVMIYHYQVTSIRLIPNTETVLKNGTKTSKLKIQLK